MNKIIVSLLVLTFMLTTVVACSDDDTDGTQSSAPSVEGMTSENLDAWGNVSLGIEGVDSNSGITSTTSSADKDQGYEDWVPLD